MKYRNLTIIGTSHIAQQSLDEVKKIIEEENPSLICFELDKQRAKVILKNKPGGRIQLKDIRKIGVKGYLFSLLGGWAERKLGEHAGVKPGDEMREGLRLARIHKIPVGYIDQDIQVTLKRFSKALTWKEKWHFVVDLFKGFVLKEKKYTFDLSKVPSKKLIKKMIQEVKKRYPNLYTVLVEERNEYMARKLVYLMKSKPNDRIVAIVGAGHEEEIIKLIKKQINTIDVSYTLTIGS
ncbi:MAG: TraB/GumN family protein [Candidatus Woesearchaeota archaeon]|jgi:pheromone shutdown-related protein TraB|nr:TraB/GumN family protein [Candidatus Woesearchaeota archaeon]MDP7457931.1 TraB/GumN family protein [Candidatus Woesearchaeota archaeon]|tara:strand:+ start:304 stop:1014 length:711 start_codon:yes stop_codon:yes gene_type:complete